MAFFSQLKLLIWKNLKLKWRQKLRLVLEIVWPLMLFLILLLVRSRADLRQNMHECHYSGKPMPSAGVLPFTQGIVCTFNNLCQETMTEDELAGVINNFNNSLISEVLHDFEVTLQSNTKRNKLSDLIDDFNTLNKLIDKQDNPGEFLKSLKGINVRNLLNDPDKLLADIKRQNISIPRSDLIELFNSTLNVSAITGNFTMINGSYKQSVLSVSNKLMQISRELMAKSPNETIDFVKKRVCDGGHLTTYIIFKNETVAQDLQRRLCALPRQQMEELYYDVKEQLNETKFINEFSRYTHSQTGNHLKIDLSVVKTMRKIAEDMQNMPSFEKLIDHLNATFEEVRATERDKNATDRMGDISRLVCGRRDAFKRKNGDESNIKKLEDRFKNQNHKLMDGGDENDEDMTPFCRDTIKDLKENMAMRILWRQIKPMIRGNIAYSPDTAAVRAIIQKANGTFQQLGNILNLMEDWLNSAGNISQFVQKLPTQKQMMEYYDYCETLEGFRNNGSREVCGKMQRYFERSFWTKLLNSTNNEVTLMRNYIQCFRMDRFIGYKTEEELETESMKYIVNNTFWAAVVFDMGEMAHHNDSLPSHIKYKIRLSADRVDSTKNIMDRYWTPGPRDRPVEDLKYVMFGFSYIQDMIDEAIVSLQTGREGRTGVVAQQFPYPCYIHDRFVLAIGRTLPMLMVLAWIFFVALTVKGIVYEKEERLKEAMKIMGLGDAVHWCAWFINALDSTIITTLLFLIIFKYGKVIEYSSSSVLLVFLLSFIVATISLCFLISVFFSRANLAAVCAGFVYFTMYIPYTQFILREETMATSFKLVGSLLSNVAFGFSCTYISRYEQQAIGVQWSNINSSPMPGDDFSMAKCIVMMWVDAAIYLLLTWYIEKVKPGQYGIPKPWYFPFTKSYWCPSSDAHTRSTSFCDVNPNIAINGNGNFEQDPQDHKLGVSIRHLKKVYSDGKVAVDDLCLNFYEGQITSFLGHNGAGKTTTMSILTGLYAPTDGTAYIYGKNIRTQMDGIRHSLGMCPQHNILFDRLTVDEHLWFYARLKGLDEVSVRAEREQMLKDIGLVNKRNEMAQYLSGGMKRKLSIAIAFVGNSRTVILDEPTAGVDPYARRSIWDLLLKFKKDHTVILTTHHMDEADILGDRIAIISHGQLRCCGSSLFLKNRFSSGYSLTLVRTEVGQTETTTTSSIDAQNGLPPAQPRQTLQDGDAAEPEDGAPKVTLNKMDEAMATDTSLLPPLRYMQDHTGEAHVTSFITKFIPEAMVGEDVGTQISYHLPMSSSDKFINLFKALEANFGQLGISSYGISDTTLEEVFLKVADDSDSEKQDNTVPKKRTLPGRAMSYIRAKVSLHRDTSGLLDDVDYEDDPSMRDEASVHVMNTARTTTGWRLIARQFTALLVKRWHHVRRSKKGFISEVILPAGFVCLAMIFATLIPGVSEEPPLELHPWIYTPVKGDAHLHMFYSNDAQGKAVGDQYEEMLLSPAGVGTRCMNKSVYTVKGYSCGKKGNAAFTSAVPPTNSTLPNCDCTSGWQVCPDHLKQKYMPPNRLLDTTDYLHNMTGRNITDWLKKTMTKYIKDRYGGLSFGVINQLSKINTTLVKHWFDRLTRSANQGTPIAVSEHRFWHDLDQIFERISVTDNAKVWFNNKGWASLPAYMNVLNNLILRAHLPAGRDPANYGITTVNHPMNFTKHQYKDRLETKSVRDLAVATAVIFAMGFIPASFILYLIAERVSNSKHLQFVSGVNPTIYWLSTFTWDMINFLISAVLCMLIFLAFQQQAYVSSTNAPCVMALLFLYGWAIVPMMYPFSKVFDTPSYAFVILSCGNVFLGFVSTLSTFIIELLQDADNELAKINDVLKQVYLLLPQYCLGRGLIDLAKNQLISSAGARYGLIDKVNPLEWDQIGRNLVTMFILGIVFFILNLLIEYRFFIKIQTKIEGNTVPKEKEDEDVARERRRIATGDVGDDVLRVQNMTAVYRSKLKRRKNIAVNRLSFGVPRGQCFGLLGVNGAGKTTTFKMLTGDINPTSGDASLNGYGILSDMIKVRQQMGYCPQFDALSALMTGREHLHLYARLRGIYEEDVTKVADWAIEKLGLKQYADVISGQYSGGNKRKLSTAIALIGNPPVIFLDEPTSGMDPKAKRALWTCINGIVKDGRSVILTSHSMEECEALCGRLAIMVNGEYKCIGSPQHLKNRFGSGYTLILRVGASALANPSHNICTAMATHFPNATLQEEHQNMFQYQLDLNNTCLSHMFSCLEQMRATLNIEDYSLTQTTLDQVFINFASNQADIEDKHDAITSRSNFVNPVEMRAPNGRYETLEDVSTAGSTASLCGAAAAGSARSVRSDTTEMTHIDIE